MHCSFGLFTALNEQIHDDDLCLCVFCYSFQTLNIQLVYLLWWFDVCVLSLILCGSGRAHWLAVRSAIMAGSCGVACMRTVAQVSHVCECHFH